MATPALMHRLPHPDAFESGSGERSEQRVWLSQALQKRRLPRAGVSDNGAAYLAAEITKGFAQLGIPHEAALAYSPYQNCKCECLGGKIEGD